MQAGKILLADDDSEDRFIINDAMGSIHNKEVFCFAENGEQALRLLEQQYEAKALPCLVVLDLNMPKLNGTQTLKHLKSDARFENIPVIIYTTSINPLERDKCLALGAHSYITKPVSFSESMETARIFLKFCPPASDSNNGLNTPFG